MISTNEKYYCALDLAQNMSIKIWRNVMEWDNPENMYPDA
jgi:hypothetical protein